MLKKMQKRVCAVLALALILGMSFAGQKVQANDIAEDIAKGKGWILDANGKVTIENDAGMKDWEENGVNTYFRKVTSADIKEGVTCIGYRAFENTGIKEIVIPSTIETLADKAFADCGQLTRVTIPASVKHIDREVFKGSALKEVLFEGSPTVGEEAFGCPIENVVFRSEAPVSFQKDAFSAYLETGGRKIDYAPEIIFHIPEGSTEVYKEELKKSAIAQKR